MPTPKLQAARKLIENKEYSAARSVLATIVEPSEDVVTAARWMAKLDSMVVERQTEARVKARHRAQAWFIILVIALCMLFILGKRYSDSYYIQKATTERMLKDIEGTVRAGGYDTVVPTSTPSPNMLASLAAGVKQGEQRLTAEAPK